MSRLRPNIACTAAVLVLLPAWPALAKQVGQFNEANQLGGANLTVHYSAIFGTQALETGSVTYALVGDAATKSVKAPADPNFTFSVVGETSLATWELVNTTAPAADPSAVYISMIELDLRPSRGGVFPSLFDNDSMPSTPNSDAGLLGIMFDPASTAPAPTSAVESLPWTDPDNKGDMFGKLTIDTFIAPGQSFKWKDDTDLVVEPADFDEDGAIDGEDLTNWRLGFGTETGALHSQGDADNDGEVDGADFLIWQHGGSTFVAGSQIAAVPEPGGVPLASLAGCALALRRRQRRS
jgi:hypothetical protein